MGSTDCGNRSVGRRPPVLQRNSRPSPFRCDATRPFLFRFCTLHTLCLPQELIGRRRAPPTIYGAPPTLPNFCSCALRRFDGFDARSTVRSWAYQSRLRSNFSLSSSAASLVWLSVKNNALTIILPRFQSVRVYLAYFLSS